MFLWRNNSIYQCTFFLSLLLFKFLFLKLLNVLVLKIIFFCKLSLTEFKLSLRFVTKPLSNQNYVQKFCMIFFLSNFFPCFFYNIFLHRISPFFPSNMTQLSFHSLSKLWITTPNFHLTGFLPSLAEDQLLQEGKQVKTGKSCCIHFGQGCDFYKNILN